MKAQFNKNCTICGVEFVAKQHRRILCDDEACRYAHAKARNPRARFEAHLKTKYGLSLERYDEILAEQGGVCLICRKAPVGKRRNERLSVDHNHETGKVRGILCHQCNAGLGWFRDDPKLLRSAAEYLEKPPTT
ncbi:MAG: endonuclease VII domain-containing protein [Planctomycetes bacterium]|nr:endonuclease VII domain-containing protein [Planctomycetota bacterium]